MNDLDPVDDDHVLDFFGVLAAFSLAMCLLACRKTFGWNTRCAASSVVISVACFGDFFFGMVTL